MCRGFFFFSFLFSWQILGFGSHFLPVIFSKRFIRRQESVFQKIQLGLALEPQKILTINWYIFEAKFLEMGPFLSKWPLEIGKTFKSSAIHPLIKSNLRTHNGLDVISHLRLFLPIKTPNYTIWRSSTFQAISFHMYLKPLSKQVHSPLNASFL